MSPAEDPKSKYETPMYLPFSDLRVNGLVWLINRVVFHPRGFALALHFDDDENAPKLEDGRSPLEQEPKGWSILGDGSEVWTFTEEADDEEFAKVKAFFDSLPMEPSRFEESA